MKYRCNQCGLESEIEQAFAQVKKPFGRQVKRYCPTCWEKYKLRELKNVGMVLLCLIAWGVILSISGPTRWYGLLILKLVFAVVLSVPLVLLHELSHAVVSRLLHLRVFVVALGYGRTVLSRRIWNIDWEIRSIPIGGSTAVGSPPIPHLRLRLFLIYLAGPSVHIILLILLSAAWWMLTLNHPVDPHLVVYLLDTLVEILIYANLALLIGSLFPSKGSTPYGQIASDGLQLIKIPRWTQQKLQEHFQSYYLMEIICATQNSDLASAHRWVEQGLEKYPSNPFLLNGLGVVLSRLGEYKQARQVYVQLLDSPEAQKPQLYAILLNNVAFDDLMLEDGTLLSEADQYSAKAFQMAAWDPSITGTRGSVLVELGQYDEGISLLKDAMARHNHANNKAMNACYLAIAEARQARSTGSDLASARLYLESACKLDPTCQLLRRAEEELNNECLPNKTRLP